MTEPTPAAPIAHDPLTAIVVMLTELKVEVRQSLTQLSKHDETISAMTERTDRLDSRVTVLETRQRTDDQHERRRVDGKAVFWGAIGAIAMCATVLTAILSYRHGG
jgi:hypothetical protein